MVLPLHVTALSNAAWAFSAAAPVAYGPRYVLAPSIWRGMARTARASVGPPAISSVANVREMP